MALGMAIDHLRAYPNHNILIAALETCSLTFQRDDTSRKNLVGTALFGDGAGAALASGHPGLARSPHLLDHSQHHFPRTEEIMGWEVVDTGFRLTLSPELPELVHKQIKGLVARFLENHDLAISDLQHLLLHPGGPKVLEAVLDALQVPRQKARLAEKVLAESGNLSSVSILAVLQKWFETGGHKEKGPGLMIAFGPGFTCTMVLFEA
jgi:alkylresorcinol/alkylpyrone synthase